MTNPDSSRNGDVSGSPGAVPASSDDGRATAPGSPTLADTEAGTSVTEDPDATVGTGSAIALGCIAATLLLIVIGLVFLAIVAFLN